MHFFGSAFLTAAFVFTGAIVAYPTINNDVVVGSLQDALDILGDDSILEKRAAIGQIPPCKLDRLQVPLGNGVTRLTDPGGLKLTVVAIGHGTQNYTCADSTANSKPVATGAHAKLYDASRLACRVPGVLNWLPYIFLHKPRAIHGDKLPRVGLHFFFDATTPVFEVERMVVAAKKGRFVGRKLENIPAPSDANPGVAPNAFGAVDWLKLVTKDNVWTASGESYTSKGYKIVYRVQTAGGKPPATCAGHPGHLEIPYATQYWLFE